MCLNNIAYSGQTPVRNDKRLGVVRIGNGRQCATTRDTGSAIYLCTCESPWQSMFCCGKPRCWWRAFECLTDQSHVAMVETCVRLS